MEEKYLAESWWAFAASVRAYRGEADRAFELLEIAYENEHPSVINTPRGTIDEKPSFRSALAGTRREAQEIPAMRQKAPVLTGSTEKSE